MSFVGELCCILGGCPTIPHGMPNELRIVWRAWLTHHAAQPRKGIDASWSVEAEARDKVPRVVGGIISS